MTRPGAIEIDLYSDTLTRPTAEMRRFMCEAEVGDEQKHEDPTVNLLQEMVADLLGKEAAVFLPSGTMCNEIALRVHCRPGEEMLAHHTAHPIHVETGGPGALAGVNIRPLDGPRGQYDVAALEAGIRPDFRHYPRSRLVWVEQTSNLGGGSIWPLERVRAVTEVARRHRLSTHLDGARLMNAVVASGVAARDWAGLFDSAWIDANRVLVLLPESDRTRAEALLRRLTVLEPEVVEADLVRLAAFPKDALTSAALLDRVAAPGMLALDPGGAAVVPERLRRVAHLPREVRDRRTSDPAA